SSDVCSSDLKSDYPASGLHISQPNVTSVTASISMAEQYSPRRYSFLVATFGVTMEFEWDAAKNRSNIRKHGFDLSDAAETIQGALLVRPDTREECGESRWI